MACNTILRAPRYFNNLMQTSRITRFVIHPHFSKDSKILQIRGTLHKCIVKLIREWKSLTESINYSSKFFRINSKIKNKKIDKPFLRKISRLEIRVKKSNSKKKKPEVRKKLTWLRKFIKKNKFFFFFAEKLIFIWNEL